MTGSGFNRMNLVTSHLKDTSLPEKQSRSGIQQKILMSLGTFQANTRL